MDETGINTNQKGENGRVKRGCRPGERLRLKVSTSDHRATYIPLVAASGNIVCHIVIFQSQSENIPVEWTTGLDLLVPEEQIVTT